MQFRNLLTLLLSALPLTLAADLGNNAITAPVAGDVITAGEPYAIKWTNMKGNLVTITLIDGPANQVHAVKDIATNAPNTGVFTWSVPDDLPASQTYAIRISYNNNPADYNYSDRFTFENTNTVSSAAVSSHAETSTAPSTKTATTSSDPSSETESATSESKTGTTKSESATSTAASTESEATTTTEASSKSESKTETATSHASETTGSAKPNQTTVSRAAKTTSQTVQTDMAPVDHPSSASRSVSGSFIAAIAGMMIGGALLL
ncbi:hypothetical protein TWF281_002833 [Arthrobotrys megalospora]